MEHNFYEILRELALVPSASYFESCIRQPIISRLEAEVDSVKIDKIGNIYTMRKGEKPGMIMLCAHQDKILQASGGIVRESFRDSNMIFTPKSIPYFLSGESHFVKTEKGFEKIDFSILKEKEQKIVRRKSKDRFSSYLTLEGAYANVKIPKNIEFFQICSLGMFEDDKVVSGKMDDTIGLSLVIDAVKSTDRKETPTILTVFTTQEEVGLRGAEFCARNYIGKKYSPDRIIVLDTTPMQNLGKGIVIYQDGGYIRNYEKNNKNENGLGKELMEFARLKNIPLTPRDGVNDFLVFSEMTDIPTVALETPIRNMHSPVETCAKADIEMMRNFLKLYLTK